MEEEKEEVVNGEVEEGALNEMVMKVEIAFSGTQNRSAPGLDGISNRFIAGIKDTFLYKKVIEKMARNLIKGVTSREWQNSKVVMIPKPGKHNKTRKGWRPINLIKCIRKLGEKVVAKVLQYCGLLDKYQFGSVKGRSVTEAALRKMISA